MKNPIRSSNATAPAPESPPRVPPLDYRTLRLVTELAMGTNGERTQFDINDDGVSSVPGMTPPSDRRVQIPTATSGRTGAMRYVALQAADAGNSFNVLEVAADAVFWSESAVEKFVLPFVASAFGARAADAVTWVQTAFTVPWDNVRVLALVHLSGFPAGEPVQLERMWGVLFVDAAEGRLQMLSLPRFLEYADPRTSPILVTPTVRLDAGTLPPDPAFLPSATQLRGMAEWASSIRDTPMYFLYNVVTGEYSRATYTLPPVLGDEIVIPAYTPPQLPGRTAPDGVWLQPDSVSSPVDVASVGDAAFWSTGALERFLYPYYASAAGAGALQQLIRLHEVWESGVISQGAGAEVYAIIHLPKSNWVAESAAKMSAEPVHGLGVLYAKAADVRATELVPLRTFLAMPC